MLHTRGNRLPMTCAQTRWNTKVFTSYVNFSPGAPRSHTEKVGLRWGTVAVGQEDHAVVSTISRLGGKQTSKMRLEIREENSLPFK